MSQRALANIAALHKSERCVGLTYKENRRHLLKVAAGVGISIVASISSVYYFMGKVKEKVSLNLPPGQHERAARALSYIL